MQLPKQKHPSHHHKLKEETFQILSGTLNVRIDGKKKILRPGDTCLVLPEYGTVFIQILDAFLKKFLPLTTIMTLFIKTKISIN